MPSVDAQSVVNEMEMSYKFQTNALDARESGATQSALTYAMLSQAAATRALVKVSLYAIQNSISIAREAVHDSQA